VPSYLETVGASVRSHRERRGWSRRELAQQRRSERFLAQLETGDGNISCAGSPRSHALEPTIALLASADAPTDVRPIALLGVAAPAATVGAALAGGRDAARGNRSADRGSCRAPLGEVFALHGERTTGRNASARSAARGSHAVRACHRRSIVNDPTNYALLRSRCQTIWLHARPEDHWNRVVAQGDQRPMAENPHAFAELRALLAARAKLYARADHTIETSGRRVASVVTAVAEAVG
jgi:XRE family aerobic/anaerobic benzoate catabolism transcriptional regulator